MTNRFQINFILILALASLLTAALPAPGQNAYQAPKTWHNQPDLQGIWQVMNRANFNMEAHHATLGVPAGQSVVTDPADGKIPYKPEALARRDRNRANAEAEDPVNKCFIPGVPRLMYLPFPFQIFQTEDQVTITSEYVHNVRNIFLKRKEHLDGVDFWNGDSIGRWEGDTLVVDVGNFNGNTWLDRSGNYHGNQLRVVERFTRIGPNTLQYQATLEDPEVFSRPWTMTMLMYRHQEPNFRLMEYECHSYLEDEAAASGQ
jgi:hypothetical protein